MLLITKNKISISTIFRWINKNSRMKSDYYITTPIFYVNANPHIGHLYTALIGDAVKRHQQLLKPERNIKFFTGTDEHGLKIYQAALKNGTTELEYCNQISENYKTLFDTFDVSYDDFLRTVEERHVEAVKRFWNILYSNGHIYHGKYSGWYCVADEAFVPQSQVEPENNDKGQRFTVEGKKLVEFIEEDNYKFKLSQFTDDLLYWLKKDVIFPSKFQKQLKEWITEGSSMNDLSVSRPVHRVSWGIQVPNDKTQIIYVWLDALVCYLTSSGYPNLNDRWPADLQIIGKDILKFHGIYWPAFLIGANLEPPRRILCHSHWLINDEKMSKSKGNVVDPLVKQEFYSSDGFRYFLLREGVPHSDGNYSETKIKRILNSELADNLGNLLNRCCGKAVNNRQTFPSFNKEDFNKYCFSNTVELISSLEDLPDTVNEHYNSYSFYKGIDSILNTLRLTNKFFEDSKPWELRKREDDSQHLSCVLHLTMESLRVSGIMFQPIIPNISKKLLDKLNIPITERSWSHIKPFSWQLTADKHLDLAKESLVLFKRLEKSNK